MIRGHAFLVRVKQLIRNQIDKMLIVTTQSYNYKSPALITINSVDIDYSKICRWLLYCYLCKDQSYLQIFFDVIGKGYF